MKIAQVAALVMMLVFVWPAVKYWSKNSPKGSSNDWLAAIIPLILVIGFVVLLIKMV